MIEAFVIVGSMYALWAFFLVAMALKRAKMEGTLSKTAAFFGWPLVFVGYVLDAFANMTFMSIILLELPRWNEGEILVTDRLKRIRKTETNWRKHLADWFVPLLNPYDPGGPHI